MTKVTSLPDNVEFDVAADETLLAAALGSDVAFAHACGGRAKCSTCRVWVLDGLETCPERTELETSMAARLGLTREVRLACQLRPRGRLRIRRLVIDETDLMMCSQLDRAVAARSGEAKKVTIYFSDVAGFTSLAERLPAYDVMYILNRYFVQAGDIIERNGGYIDKFVGDGLMAIANPMRRFARYERPCRHWPPDTGRRGSHEAVLRVHVRRRFRYTHGPALR
jgi:ferredoxin